MIFCSKLRHLAGLEIRTTSTTPSHHFAMVMVMVMVIFCVFRGQTRPLFPIRSPPANPGMVVASCD